MSKVKLFIALLALVALVAACAREEPTPTPIPATEAPPAEAQPTEAPTEEPAAEPAVAPTEEMMIDSELVGVQWYWQEFQDTAEVNSFTVPSPNYTILFNADGTANIQADCNMVGASYTAENGALSLMMGPSTLAFCGEDSLDQVFLQRLGEVATYVIQDGMLYLNLMADAGNLVFGNEPPAEPVVDSELVGIKWHWEDFQDTAGLNSFSVPDPSDYTILFNADGTANIQADCNMVTASYTVEGSSLTIMLGASTLAFCGEESLDQIFLARLGEVASYVIQDGVLYLNLVADAGNMVFGRGPLTIAPEQIMLDTQDLPYSWQAVVVPGTPYDESQPPGPKGLPEHIEILFGVTDPADRQPLDPVMYLIPVNAYRDLWDEAGNEGVSTTMDAIQQIAFTMTRPEGLGLPTLPYEELRGTNDIAVQFGRAVPAGEVNETSATQTGYRFVGRWSQGPNAVTNQGMQYVYQGFTNDGYYLVSFWYPVSSSALAADASQVPAEEMNQVDQDVNAYLSAKSAELDALATSDWEPDLATLDAVVASLQIEGMVASGLQEKTWLWTEGPAQPGSSEIVQIDDPTLYQVTYGLDGTVNVVADCNLANFPYQLNQTGMAGGMLAQPGPVTLAQCAPESLSDSFINSIQASQDYRVLAGGDTLELSLPAGGGVLRLRDLASYDATADLPGPEAGEPTATVTSDVGANVRTGPGTNYPILGVAPLGTTGRVVGVSEDNNWWVVFVPGAPNDQGWVSSSVVEVTNLDSAPVISAPPPPAQPTPAPSPTPTSVPSTDITFEASRTTINAGESATLSWSVENVQAVYMFPVGANFQNYPVTGQGSREVRPGITTTYMLLVVNTDGSTSSESIEITVVGGLTANQWTLQSYSSPDLGLRTPIPGTQITARFEANGSLSGSAGCNTYSGGFTAYDQTLRVSSPLAVTRTICDSPAGIMEQESAFISLMQQAARFNISAGQLSVFDSRGNRILVFISG